MLTRNDTLKYIIIKAQYFKEKASCSYLKGDIDVNSMKRIINL